MLRIEISAGVIFGAAMSVATAAAVEGVVESLVLGDNSSVVNEAKIEE